MKGLGIVLIIIGIVMMVFRSFNFTEKKKVVDLGPVQVNKEEEHTVNWPLYAGIVVTAAGVVVLLTSNKNKA